jgi:hypothetical protein
MRSHLLVHMVETDFRSRVRLLTYIMESENNNYRAKNEARRAILLLIDGLRRVATQEIIVTVIPNFEEYNFYVMQMESLLSRRLMYFYTLIISRDNDHDTVDTVGDDDDSTLTVE